MATTLYRLGRFGVRCHRSALLSWRLLLLLAAAGAATAGGKIDEGVTIPGPKSHGTLDGLADRLPADGEAFAHFGALLAAGLCLVSAVVAAGVGLAALLSATGLVVVSSTALTLSLMPGLVVGIGHALLVISRHRGQPTESSDARHVSGRATGIPGNAVVFAGLTTVVAMSGRAVVPVPFVTFARVAVSLTVAMAVAAEVTVIPALRGLAGHRRGHALFAAQVRLPGPPTGHVALGALAVPATDLRPALPLSSD
ncbi:MMPL family transporter [Streptomyces sp. NPDC101237]|uniref:MMPL family transporter n=1 Tax=Streptomyces sp. NPDC101237 TaxID=3366139 RepID=UPI003817855D